MKLVRRSCREDDREVAYLRVLAHLLDHTQTELTLVAASSPLSEHTEAAAIPTCRTSCWRDGRSRCRPSRRLHYRQAAIPTRVDGVDRLPRKPPCPRRCWEHSAARRAQMTRLRRTRLVTRDLRVDVRWVRQNGRWI